MVVKVPSAQIAFAIILAASLVLAGCVSNPNDDAATISALNSSLETTQLKYDAELRNKAALEDRAATAEAQAAALSRQLDDEKQAHATVEARETATVARMRELLTPANNSAQLYNQMFKSYRGMADFACDKYFLSGGYSSGGSITIPAYCRYTIADLLIATQNYLGSVQDNSSAEALGYINNNYK